MRILYIIIILILIIWIAWGNKALQLQEVQISGSIPESLNGCRIAHISDLHNTEIGKNNRKLLKMLEDAKPDMIAITGDLIDSRRTDLDVALRFVAEAVKIAPCFYVPGNHESRIDNYNDFRNRLSDLGVAVLDNERVKLQLSDQSVTILGVRDPSFYWSDDRKVIGDALDDLIRETDSYTILLSHRPELFEVYVSRDVNLVLCGHAHGGQFRIPWLGGLFAPSQGFFPKYDAGCYAENKTTMVVSRGIGNSVFPFRINNRPEVILIELVK